MKTVTISKYPQNFAPTYNNGIESLIGKLWSSMNRRNTYKRDIKHLNFLSDEHLSDIGLQREEISSAVSGTSPKYFKILDLV